MVREKQHHNKMPIIREQYYCHQQVYSKMPVTPEQSFCYAISWKVNSCNAKLQESVFIIGKDHFRP
jgi:hypothetical protein